MPLFGKSRRRDGESGANGVAPSAPPLDDSPSPSPHAAPRRERPPQSAPPSYPAPPPPRPATPPQPKLQFHCQLAHGSPTGIISGFGNVKELYQRIAECYKLPVSEILFCTLNTHKVDMNKLLGAQIGLDDFIFAHKKGQAKEVEITKTEDALGLTITDNGAGYAFIKRIKEDSVIDRIGHIKVGDHVERIDDVSLVGCRHFDVARMLKEIPVGTTFTLRAVEPLTAGFANIGPRSGPKSGSKAPQYGSGKATLRFRANGPAVVEQAPTDLTEAGTDKINELLDGFLGISDGELAAQIWELGENKRSPEQFAEALDNSELEAFGFTDEFVIELWSAITGVRALNGSF
ncbi:PDZ domain-containing protein GIPC3-like [Amphibalanus amphitrite]|uniref:PDZ domain-containing protein GIPC3-like n=1 Tax=Amphibalanus amphitrite TaxID=1232801 RepID=UPI001C9117DE|nr:PDZ domain-containing protein GIPC3-like [Amphibalanus amphitrite]